MGTATAAEPQLDHPVQRHVHRRNVVEDMRYDGTEEGAEALCRWVRSHGGEAEVHLDGLLVKTQVKWVRVPAGYWVGHGVIGQFWVISNEVHVGSYDPVEDGFGAAYDLSEDQLRSLRTEAGETSNVERLREIVGLVVAAAVA